MHVMPAERSMLFSFCFGLILVLLKQVATASACVPLWMSKLNIWEIRCACANLFEKFPEYHSVVWHYVESHISMWPQMLRDVCARKSLGRHVVVNSCMWNRPVSKRNCIVCLICDKILIKTHIFHVIRDLICWLLNKHSNCLPTYN